MQTRSLTVPRGKDMLVVRVNRHTHVVLRDAAGTVRSRWDSEGKHVTFPVEPGRYTVETDGRLGALELRRLDPAVGRRGPLRADRPPPLRRRKG